MKKDEIKVLIDSEEKFNEAKSLLLELGQEMETYPEFKYDGVEMLYYNTHLEEWCKCPNEWMGEEIIVTLDQLREILSVESTQKMSN
jgi:hypothetical protein